MEKPVLRFHENGRFRFHAGERFNPMLTAGLDALLEHTKPDFVMLVGDQCLPQTEPDAVRSYMCEIMEPVLRRHLPWGAVFGNHDREIGLDIAEEEAVYESIPGCLSERGPQTLHGIGNYCLPIYAHDSDRVAYHLWGLDSNRYITDYPKLFGMAENPEFILPTHNNENENGATPLFNQILWYWNKSAEAEKREGYKVPGVMFMHIPVPEYLEIIRNPEECGAIGSKRATLGCSEISSGLFLACLERGDIRGMFFGHEHHCDIQGVYGGMTMACDAALGYNMSAHDDLRGGRVIDLLEDGTMETRMVKLWDIMGRACMRDPDYFEGGCRYFIRKL